MWQSSYRICLNNVQPKLNWKANLGLQKISLLERPARTNSRVQNTVAQPLIKVVPHVSEGSENITPSLGGRGGRHTTPPHSHMVAVAQHRVLEL